MISLYQNYMLNGTLCILFQAYGMAAWPIDLIKGSRNVRGERMTIREQREETRTQIDAIRAKVVIKLHIHSFRSRSLIYRFTLQQYLSEETETLYIFSLLISDLNYKKCTHVWRQRCKQC